MARKLQLNWSLKFSPSAFFVVGGDIAFFVGSFHFEEVASKAWDHTISSYSLRVVKHVIKATKGEAVTNTATLRYLSTFEDNET